MKRICLKCGTEYEGRDDSTLCPKCAAESIKSVVRQRVCTVCGRSFKGGPNAIYCPDCRTDRRRERERIYRERQKLGNTRKLGSTDICEVCGKEYIVTGGLQKYCTECSAEAIAAKDRIKSREWNRQNIDYDKQREDRQKATAPRKCVICGKEYIPDGGGSVTCSRECAAEHRKRQHSKWETEHREERNEYHKKQYHSKTSAMAPDELAEYREKINARARENYKKRKEKENQK